ncbi:MAG TPA: MauE/DoxX family redox-associated membrane protein, partial [Acidimicrobiia bacterium]
MIRPVWSIVTPIARVALAGVWVYAALTKIGDPDAAVRAVRAYQVLPEWLVEPVAWGLPFLELALAALLVTGLAPRAAAWASLVVLGVFVAGIASVWARGLQIDCGCFGEGGPADVDGFDYFVDIARDVGFAVLALIAALGPDDPLQLRPRLPSRLRTWAGQAAVLALTVLAATAVGFVVQRERSELES